jgi:coenzyme F420-reducing hydrogenase delta subunit
MGVEPGRIHFSWVSSAESTKFVDVVKQVTEAVKAVGPHENFKKTQAKVA